MDARAPRKRGYEGNAEDEHGAERLNSLQRGRWRMSLGGWWRGRGRKGGGQVVERFVRAAGLSCLSIVCPSPSRLGRREKPKGIMLITHYALLMTIIMFDSIIIYITFITFVTFVTFVASGTFVTCVILSFILTF